jgi:hypothetical protein
MEIELNNIKWAEFNLHEVFSSIQRGKRLKKDDHKKGNHPYVSSSALNNGVDGFVCNTEKVRKFKKCLTIANSGSVGATFFQPFSFVASDHITKLENQEFSKEAYLFISKITKRLSEKYSFNREINDKRIHREKILLPINSNGKPDFAFMEQFMRQKEQEKLQEYNNYISKRLEALKNFKPVEAIEEMKWAEFKIVDLFDFEKGDQNNMVSIKKGVIPLVSAKKGENGYKDFAIQLNKKLFAKNSLTINNDGDGGAGISFYQPYDYLLDGHVTALYPKEKLNRFALLYISRCITDQRNKFGHGYSINSQRLNALKFMLPIDKKGQPDYAYMENYIKKIEYEKLKDYASFKKWNPAI